MPFMSYDTSIPDATADAGRFLKEGGAVGVKLEGGTALLDTVRAFVRGGIPTVGDAIRTSEPSTNMMGSAVTSRGSERGLGTSGSFCAHHID